jgi:ankyrin repeat protein
MIAAAYSTPEIVTLLLERGADIEARDDGGNTPLMVAAEQSSTPAILTLLLEKGADPLAEDKYGRRAIDIVQWNDDLKGTEAYWKLRDRTFD